MASDPVPSGRRFLDPHFRWRGTDVTRTEAFADAVFAIVLTLLFLQSKVPECLAELKAAMLSLVPFAVTFTMVAMVWVEHHRLFRRYGLRDKGTFFGNLWLLFLVLVYAYPLKFLFTLLFVAWVGPIGGLTLEAMAVGKEQLGTQTLMLFYGFGFGAIYATFALLYRHALRRADDLQLDDVERHLTSTSMQECLVLVAFAWAVFGVSVHGNLAALATVCVMGAMTFGGLALLVSSRAKTIEGVSGLLNLVMVPGWVFSGVFFASSNFPDAMQPMVQALPLTALNDALRAVMNDGESLAAIWRELATLAAWGVASFALALRWFRWS